MSAVQWLALELFAMWAKSEKNESLKMAVTTWMSGKFIFLYWRCNQAKFRNDQLPKRMTVVPVY